MENSLKAARLPFTRKSACIQIYRAIKCKQNFFRCVQLVTFRNTFLWHSLKKIIKIYWRLSLYFHFARAKIYVYTFVPLCLSVDCLIFSLVVGKRSNGQMMLSNWWYLLTFVFNLIVWNFSPFIFHLIAGFQLLFWNLNWLKKEMFLTTFFFFSCFFMMKSFKFNFAIAFIQFAIVDASFGEEKSQSKQWSSTKSERRKMLQVIYCCSYQI